MAAGPQDDGHGGLERASILKAAKADLITLPKGVEGTNCGNCKYFAKGMCRHPQVGMPVNDRMCCVFWDADGVYRPWTGAKNAGQVAGATGVP